MAPRVGLSRCQHALILHFVSSGRRLGYSGVLAEACCGVHRMAAALLLVMQDIAALLSRGASEAHREMTALKQQQMNLKLEAGRLTRYHRSAIMSWLLDGKQAIGLHVPPAASWHLYMNFGVAITTELGICHATEDLQV